MVLLKNKNNTLPLSKTIRKIAVVGPNAADSTMLWANYNGFPTHTVTILEGIRNKVPDTEVIYELGCNHAADFVIKTWATTSPPLPDRDSPPNSTTIRNSREKPFIKV